MAMMLDRGAPPPRTLFRFVLVGLVNTVTGLAVIYFCKWVLSAPDVLANVAGYAVGLVVSYMLNARWTFSFHGPLAPTATRFALTMAVGYLANLALVTLALNMGVNSYVAQATGVAPYAVVTYLGLKHFVFVAAPAGTV
jgi:putative flippase GtrA